MSSLQEVEFGAKGGRIDFRGGSADADAGAGVLVRDQGLLEEFISCKEET